MSNVCQLASFARLTRTAAVVIILLAGVFAWYARLPLAHTDLWGHLCYGRLICQTGSLPAREPFLPLAVDTPLVDTAWLSQVWLYQVARSAGLPGLQAWHAGLIVLCAALLVALIGRNRSPHRAFVGALTAMGVFVGVEWFQLAIARPQTAGLVCFVGLIAFVPTCGGNRGRFWIVPARFALWAHLPGSFVTGLAWLVALALGRALDVASRAGRGSAILIDRRTQGLVALVVLGGIATLLNPYRIRLWIEVLSFPRQPNLADLTEWQPLDLRTTQASLFIASVVAAGIAGAIGRRRLAWAELLPMLLFGTSTIVSARMVVWWGPVVAQFIARRVALRSLGSDDQSTTNASRSWLWSTLVLVACAAAWGSSPLGRQMLGLPAGQSTRRYSERAPLEAAAYLRAHPPDGLVFSRSEWGGYLIWAGPPDLCVFATSHVERLPVAVWQDYRAISAGAPESVARLANYDVAMVVLEAGLQGRLVRELSGGGWRRVQADGLTEIYARPDVPGW
ncbi:MAG: hypothetical protein ACT4QC_15980 [Planctomycetaceae bacterium]